MRRKVPASEGQSLLEVVVLIGLALVIITGLTIVTVNGLKNTQFSQNQAQATRLSQDGVDKIRTMKDQNCPVNIGSASYYWYNNSSLIWAQDPSGNSFSFQTATNPAICGLQQPNGIYLQSQAANSPDTSLPATLQTTFTRLIAIENFSPTQKKVTVIVKWTDISGSHQSILSTILGEN